MTLSLELRIKPVTLFPPSVALGDITEDNSGKLISHSFVYSWNADYVQLL